MAVQMTLDRIEKDKDVRVVEIRGGWGIRQCLFQLGIHVGDEIRVKRSAIFKGPILVQIHGTDVALGLGMARHIDVEVP